MDQKDLIKYGLIAIGAYLVYKYVEANGGLSAVLGTTAAAGTLPTGTPPAITAPKTAATPPPTPPASTAVGATSTDTAGNIYFWNGTAWILKTAALPPPPATTAAGCPVGQVNVNGTCIAQVVDPISQLMVGLATSAGAGVTLNMDQWCYYYTEVTGLPCPVDPGGITPGLYAGAGIVDRTTPTDIGTWLAIMQNQAPALGLTGIGDARYLTASAGWLT